MITIGVGAPEAGWPPFVEWLSRQGVEPTMCTQITFDPETLNAEVLLFKTKDKIATYRKRIQLISLPPRKTGS
jgi:hypothetical protein